MIIRTYGSSYNGITSSASQFLNLIAILTVGVTASTRVALYSSLAKDNVTATSRIVRATEQYMRKVGGILAGYIILLAFIYPLAVKTGYSFWEISSLVLIVGMSSFAEYFFGITYRTLLASDQCVYISNIFTIIATTLNLVLSVLLIQLGYSIQIVKLGSAVVYVLKPVLQSIYVRKRYCLDRRCEPDMSALKNRRYAMVHAIANIVHNNTDLVILTLFTDVKIVSVYTVYNLVLSALSKIQSIFTTGVEPIFGNMWVRKELDAIKKNLSLFEFFISVFVSVAFSIAYLMILPFVALYTKNVTDVNYVRPVYAMVTILAFAFFAFRAPYIALVQGAGHYRQTKSAAVWEASINLTLSVLLVIAIPVQEYKMVGVAFGTLVANLFRTVQYAVYIDSNIFSRGKHVFALKIGWTLLNMIIIVFSSRVFLNRLSINSWTTWLICSACIGIFSIVVTLLSATVFYRNDLKYGDRG
ncbi:MAG: sugar isomerase [Eubacterium sp.]|nr:sugar isomerase [Eubacterium sp.]